MRPPVGQLKLLCPPVGQQKSQAKRNKIQRHWTNRVPHTIALWSLMACKHSCSNTKFVKQLHTGRTCGCPYRLDHTSQRGHEIKTFDGGVARWCQVPPYATHVFRHQRSTLTRNSLVDLCYLFPLFSTQM